MAKRNNEIYEIKITKL